MALDYLNQNTPTNLDELTGKQSTPDNINTDMAGYIAPISPQSAGYVDNLTQQQIGLQNQMYQQAAPDKLFRTDIFPTQDEPVTQQGVQGEYVKMPTIAPTGALFPYGLIYEQERQRKKSDEDKAKANALNLTMTELFDPKANAQYAKSMVDFYQKSFNNAKDVYGDNAGMALKNDMEFNTAWKVANKTGELINEVATLSAKILSATKADDPYTSDATRKLARNYGIYADEFLKAVDMGNYDDIIKIGGKLEEVKGQLITAQNIQAVLKTANDNLGSQDGEIDWLVANPLDINGNPIGTADEKGVVTNKLKSLFIAIDKDETGNVMGYKFDENAARDHFSMVFNGVYPDIKKNEDGTYSYKDKDYDGVYPNPNEFIQMGVNGLKKERSITIDKFNTNALGYRKQIFDEKQAKAQYGVPVVAPLKDETGKYVSQDLGGGLTISRIYDIPQNYYYDDKGNKRSVSPISGVTLDATDANGNPIKISANDELTPVKMGTAKNKQVVVASRWNENTGVTDEVRFNYNAIPTYMDKIASFTGFNSHKFKVDPENQFIAYPVGGDYSQTGANPTGKQIPGQTSTFNEPTGVPYPLPQGKPKTVSQNGNTYTWNEQTGQYE